MGPDYPELEPEDRLSPLSFWYVDNKADIADFEKRQNQLRPEDIDKIIGTYQFRKEETRYSRRGGMEEIEKNDFNLNISRYVSTAEAEKEINLATVYADLLAAEQKIAVAKERHNQYLAEFKLPLLP